MSFLSPLEKDVDLLRVIFDYASVFYHATSKSLFLRFYHLDPPSMDFTPEDAALWLWNAHNQV
jgi:hypothetical protein